ncbi:hypothetical protein E2C01_031477 [Portunus trituberculatus]|uniref:Uncharacterized protein n=1 Tax=Portunus trituberculatus TaxID=210409 RepID=A0A5B7ETK7_PORTR|nr:hypothetical protein [Portunus trituberculatus]
MDGRDGLLPPCDRQRRPNAPLEATLKHRDGSLTYRTPERHSGLSIMTLTPGTRAELFRIKKIPLSL